VAQRILQFLKPDTFTRQLAPKCSGRHAELMHHFFKGG
jgi:hypothetical protein